MAAILAIHSASVEWPARALAWLCYTPLLTSHLTQWGAGCVGAFFKTVGTLLVPPPPPRKRQTCTFAWKYQPAYSFSLYGTPSPRPNRHPMPFSA